MSRIRLVASLLLLWAGILSSSPVNATSFPGGILSSSPFNASSHPGDIITSAEEMLTEVANNSSKGATVNSTEGSLQHTMGSSARASNGSVKTTKAATFQPTGPPVMMEKPGRCPIVGLLAHVSHSKPHDRNPLLELPSRGRFKLGFSSSSSEESRSDSREGFGRLYHAYRYQELQQRLNLCRSPDCGRDGDCRGERKCCAVPGCRMKCLRPVPFDLLPGEMKRFHP